MSGQDPGRFDWQLLARYSLVFPVLLSTLFALFLKWQEILPVVLPSGLLDNDRFLSLQDLFRSQNWRILWIAFGFWNLSAASYYSLLRSDKVVEETIQQSRRSNRRGQPVTPEDIATFRASLGDVWKAGALYAMAGLLPNPAIVWCALSVGILGKFYVVLKSFTDMAQPGVDMLVPPSGLFVFLLIGDLVQAGLMAAIATEVWKLQ